MKKKKKKKTEKKEKGKERDPPGSEQGQELPGALRVRARPLAGRRGAGAGGRGSGTSPGTRAAAPAGRKVVKEQPEPSAGCWWQRRANFSWVRFALLFAGDACPPSHMADV